jgi:hypothetical protein
MLFFLHPFRRQRKSSPGKVRAGGLAHGGFGHNQNLGPLFLGRQRGGHARPASADDQNVRGYRLHPVLSSLIFINFLTDPAEESNSPEEATLLQYG